MLYKEAFLSYLRNEKRYSDHTIRAYENDLNQFRVFSETAGSTDSEFDSVLVRLWVVSLLENHVSPRTIHRKLSSLRSYARFLLREGHLKTNPLDKVLKPKMNKRIPLFVDEEHLNHFLDTYEFSTDFKGVRDRLIIELLYQTGIRRSELNWAYGSLGGSRLSPVESQGKKRQRKNRSIWQRFSETYERVYPKEKRSLPLNALRKLCC